MQDTPALTTDRLEHRRDDRMIGGVATALAATGVALFDKRERKEAN